MAQLHYVSRFLMQLLKLVSFYRCILFLMSIGQIINDISMPKQFLLCSLLKNQKTAVGFIALFFCNFNAAGQTHVIFSLNNIYSI